MQNNSANANVITVDTLVDENDGDLSRGDVSLREALATVEAGGTIRFDRALADSGAGAGKGVIQLTLGELVIDKSLTIRGLGADELTVSGNKESRVFLIDDGDDAVTSDVVIDGLTIAKGEAEQGGGILAREKLTVVNSVVTGNREAIAAKRRFFNDADLPDVTLLVKNSTISKNRRGLDNFGDDYDSAAIVWEFGDVAIKNSEIKENRSSGVRTYSNLTVNGSTITDNQGGGLESENQLSVNNSRILNNTGIALYSSDFNVSPGVDLLINNSVISGNGGNGLIATAQSYEGGSIKITNSTISDNRGLINAGGGARFAGGSLEVEDSVIENNEGGLLAWGGSVSLQNSVVSGSKSTAVNAAYVTVERSSLLDNEGAGIIGYSANVKNSTIANNKAGGISLSYYYINGGPSLDVSNSTISGNGRDGRSDGGVSISTYSRYAGYRVSIKNTTIAGNRGVAGISIEPAEDVLPENVGSSFILKNTIVADNAGADVISNNVTSRGYNLIGNGDQASGFDGPGDLVGTAQDPIDPRLGSLQDNGGVTLTQALLPNSPALDAGAPNIKTGFDQRGAGFARVLDGNGDGVARIDIGAVEVATTVISNVINGDNRRNRLLGTGQSDTIKGFGSRDLINGRGGDDLLFGGSGNDNIVGASGNDTIIGGRGIDRLRGGGGKDTFVFERLVSGRDRILDFRKGQDLIDLSAIFEDTRYNSSTPFEDYVRLGQIGRNGTKVEVLDLNRSDAHRNVFDTVAVLDWVNPDRLDADSFLL